MPPLYMDRHNVSEAVTPEQVSMIHQQDLKIQGEYNCRVISYFFDEKRNNVFCLVEAPDKESMIAMHEHSHGDIPNKVIEVNESVLTSFLGQIEVPKKEQPDDLYINRSNITRIIMAVNIHKKSLDIKSTKLLRKPLRSHNDEIVELIQNTNGNIVHQQMNGFLVSFSSAVDAVSCAINIQSNFDSMLQNIESNGVNLKIGIDIGAPLGVEGSLFENSVKLAERICNIVKEEIVVSFEVNRAYNNEMLNTMSDNKIVNVLKPTDEKFLNRLMDFIESSWDESNYKVEDIGKNLGCSKSQLYRKTVSLTGKSPNNLIKDYRLKRALLLLDEQKSNIAEIAFETGFNSPAYFSKCFNENYGILPSNYLKQLGTTGYI